MKTIEVDALHATYCDFIEIILVLTKQVTLPPLPDKMTFSLSGDAAGLWDRLPHEPGKPVQAKGPGGQVA